MVGMNINSISIQMVQVQQFNIALIYVEQKFYRVEIK